MGELFYLNFKSDGFGKVEINEPIGYASCDFQLQQKDKGYARDISFSGGENNFEFVDYRDHNLGQLLYYAHYFGFESKVELVIQIAGIENIIGELDFATAITDDLTYFRCKVIQLSDFQIIKRRKSIKVDLLSNRDIDGNVIEPLIPSNMLLLSKPVVQKSEWKNNNQIGIINSSFPAIAYNPCQTLVSYGIEDSFTFYSDARFYLSNDQTNRDNFKLITTKNTLKNLNINLKGVKMQTSSSSELFLYYEDKKITLKKIVPSDGYFEGDINYNIPFIDRNKDLSILFRVIGNNTVDIKSIEITAESISYNSITPSLRLIDVMNQVVKSISGLGAIAPEFANGGRFFDNRLFNGNFLRNITDKPFSVSLEDLEKSITEMNADYEIQSDGRVFFGTEDVFYRPVECGFFDNTQFSGMNKTFNPRFAVNEFKYGYRNFQSLKENEEPNSADTIHGESRWVLFNKMVENKKEVVIEWVRDAFLIESNRRKSLEITEVTASQDDDTLFCIDTIDTTENMSFDESTQLQHTYDVNTFNLLLRNDGQLNFIVLGIKSGTNFTIKAPDANAGNYTVFSVSNNEISLTKVGTFVISANGNGVRLTSYTYRLNASEIPFTNYTNQNFSLITNLNTPDSYSNLRYSVRRNINSFWQKYLATCNLYHKEKNVLNTWYKNNGECTTVYLGDTVTEKSDLLPKDPILSPFLYNDIVFANVELEEFIALQNAIRSDRGFIRTIDNNDRVIKIYPVTMKWEVLSKELTIKAEEKHEPKTMEINTANGYILINNETRVLTLNYDITENKVSIYDSNRQRLYNSIFWNNISINGSLSDTIEILKERLDLL